MTQKIRSTTVLCVRRNGKVVIAADGQVTFGQEVLKASAKKLRRLYNNKVAAGFAGSTADAFSLFARFEAKLEQHSGKIDRSAVELAKDWRTDRVLRRLEAMLAVADKTVSLMISGAGDVIEPSDGIIAIGSGGPYALSAAKALLEHSKLSAKEICEASLKIAGEVCIYTNTNVRVETV